MLNKTTLLFVEDDPLSREVMRIMVANTLPSGKLFIFEDSTDFMHHLNALTERPEIILLDIYVEPYDGFQLLDMLRADPEWCHAKIVALTASVMAVLAGVSIGRVYQAGMANSQSDVSWPCQFLSLYARNAVYRRERSVGLALAARVTADT